MPEISLFSGMVKLIFTKEDYRVCRNKIKRLIASYAKEEIDQQQLERQYKKIVKTIINLRYNPNKGFHLQWHRKGVDDFRNKMLKLLPAIDELIANDNADRNIELILNLGTKLKPSSKHFKLPKANNNNFLIEFKSFLLDYYERNPQFKYYKGLDGKLSLNSIYNLASDRRNKVLDENLSYKAIYYQPHRELLSTVRTFPQFKKRRKLNSILIQDEGELVLKLLGLIKYEKIAAAIAKKDTINITGFNTSILDSNIKGEIKQLRNDLSSYYKAMSSYYSG